MCTTGTIDLTSLDILAAARMAQHAKLKNRDDTAPLSFADALARLDATVNKLLDRQRALEERQDKVEREAATALSALLMVHTI
jgi:hypothetical protein